MKIVSFKVAKAIKEAGYPQTFNSKIYHWYNGNDVLDYSLSNLPLRGYYEDNGVCIAPTYLEVWLWLWKEKKICINCNLDKHNLLPMWWCTNEDSVNYNTPNFNSPEEAISSAIEYLVENNLL